jgi:hypothetical protein
VNLRTSYTDVANILSSLSKVSTVETPDSPTYPLAVLSPLDAHQEILPFIKLISSSTNINFTLITKYSRVAGIKEFITRGKINIYHYQEGKCIKEALNKVIWEQREGNI